VRIPPSFEGAWTMKNAMGGANIGPPFFKNRIADFNSCELFSLSLFQQSTELLVLPAPIHSFNRNNNHAFSIPTLARRAQSCFPRPSSRIPSTGHYNSQVVTSGFCNIHNSIWGLHIHRHGYRCHCRHCCGCRLWHLRLLRHDMVVLCQTSEEYAKNSSWK
jgi:hypothetical protein